MMKTFFFYYTILLTLHIQLHSNVRLLHFFNAKQEIDVIDHTVDRKWESFSMWSMMM